MRCLAILFLTAGVAAFAAAPIVKQTFENGTDGWTAFGKNGSVRVVDGALAFDYDAGHGLGLAVWPVSESLAGMQSIRFRLKTDAPTPVAVLLIEKPPGGRYMRIVWSPANTWQQVELQPSDFVLNDQANDPKDPDNRLDTDQLQSVALLDVGEVFGAALKSSELPLAIDVKSGKHSIFIDDFEISTEPLATAPAAESATIDDFRRPVLQWITLGGADLTAENHGLRARYQQLEDRYPLITKMFPRMDLRGWNRLAFDIASEKPAVLAISLEERNPGGGQGPRYSTTVDVLGGGKIDHRAVAFSAFSLDPNGPGDPDGKLDLDQIKTIAILDITAASTHETASNSLWIGNLHASEKQ